MARSRHLPICCLMIATCFCGRAGAAEAKPIPVVTTWGELIDADAYQVEGLKVRFGIEAATFGTRSGVLLYCLSDGPLGHIDGAVEDRLGPVRVEVRRDGAPELRSAKNRAHVLETKAPGARLYVMPVTSVREGVLTVSVLTPAEDDDAPLLAAREIEVRGTGYHTWTKLQSSDQEEAPGQGPLHADARRHRLSPSGGIWAPHREGYSPFLVEREVSGKRVRRGRDEPLPTLFPAEPHPGLRLSGDGTSLTLESDVPFAAVGVEQRLLARWWVNDQAVVRDLPLRQEPLRLEQATGLRKGPTKLRLRLEWDPAEIGARSGDRVRMQLLYAPGRARPVDGQRTALLQFLAQEADVDFVSRMSNPIEFVVR